MNAPSRALALLIAGALAIPAVSLAQPAARPFAPPDDVEFRKAQITSEGTRMAAEVFAPKSAPEGRKLPTIILCHGWGGLARSLRPEAIAFARAGYLAIAFDYRGWGDSEGRLVRTGPPPAERAKGPVTVEV